MRIILLTFILFLSNVLVSAKPRNDSLTYPIKQIKLDYSFRSDSFAIDTTIDKLHILNPVFLTEPSNTFLTTLGYPIESNYVVARLAQNDIFFPAISLLPYMHDSRQNFFYDTKRQFTSLTYKTEGGAQSNTEELLQVTHTQNLTKENNIGLLFDIYSSYSRYNYINGNDYAIKTFYRHSGDNFLTYNQIYYNSLKIKENGGLAVDSLYDYTAGTSNNNGLDVYLHDASSRLKRLGFNSINEIKLKTIFNKEDTLGKDYGSLFYNFNIEKNKRDYSDNSGTLYNNFYNGTTNTKDSIVMSRISNKIILNSPNLSKYLPNLRFSLTNDLFFLQNGIPANKISYNGTIWSFSNSRRNESSTYSSVDISQKFRQIQWNAIWDIYIQGYRAGDQRQKIEATTFVNKANTLGLNIEASNEDITPSFIYKKYFSNHFIWFNNFKTENRQNLRATLLLKNPFISITGNYKLITDYVYFGYDTLPHQSSNTINFFSIRFDNNINIWKLNIENAIIYQKELTSFDLIHIPEFIIYNSTSFVHTFHFFTGGRMFFKLGFDFYYTSSFYPDAYNPSTGTFYLQKLREEGNYPRLDAHLTLKVKTLSFFIKYSHLNAGLSGPREFNALHYPMLPATLSYGINWLFYD